MEKFEECLEYLNKLKQFRLDIFEGMLDSGKEALVKENDNIIKALEKHDTDYINLLLKSEYEKTAMELKYVLKLEIPTWENRQKTILKKTLKKHIPFFTCFFGCIRSRG